MILDVLKLDRLSEFLWRNIFSISILSVAACGVIVEPPIEQSGNKSQAGLVEIDVSTLSLYPEQVTGINSESDLWCGPGCALEADASGMPIVPNWCTAWTKTEDEYCVKNSLTDGYCISPKEELGSEYACQRINMDELRSEKSRASWSFLQAEIRGADGGIVIPSAVGLHCSCELPWSEFGARRSFVGEEKSPEWCYAFFNGCALIKKGFDFWEGGARICNAPAPRATCTQILAREG